MKGTTLTLDRDNEFIATAISRVCDDSTNKLPEHHEKIYHDKFCSLLPKGYEQIIGRARTFEHEWCVETLHHLIFCMKAHVIFVSILSGRKARIEGFCLSTNDSAYMFLEKNLVKAFPRKLI